MKDSARYIKIVEWSEEDQCYVGSSPGLLFDAPERAMAVIRAFIVAA